MNEASTPPSEPVSLASSGARTSDLKPPNDPPTGGATTTPSTNANYGSFTTNGEPPLGLSTRRARRLLLRAIERKVEEKERSHHFTTEFRDPFALLLLLCAVFRLAHYARKDVQAETTAPLLEGVFLLSTAAMNVALNATQRRRHHDEMAERVRTAVQHMLQQPQSTKADATDPPLKPTVLLPSTNLIACYRDSHWQRTPLNLLVEGDVVALMSGDLAPGAVLALNPPRVDSPVKFARGTKIPSSGETLETTRCNATFHPSLLLPLCGDMRLFEMRETPVVQDIEDAFFRISRPPTFTQKLQGGARRVAVYVCTLYSLLVLLAIALRVVLQHRSLHTTLNHISLGPIGIWLCFASLNTPFVLFFAEAAATASILGSFESAFAFNSNGGGATATPPTTATSAADDVGQEGAETITSSSIDDPLLSKLQQNAGDMYDSEERERMRSEQASQKQSALRRSLEYFLITLKFRAAATKDDRDPGWNARSFLMIPFRSFRLLERLGSTTMLCCFDDEILCEQTPSVEEIFLLNDKTGANSSTVLDMHPDRDCETGLKFEDPKWGQHLASLKPLGLSILLNDAEDPADYYHTSMGYLISETQMVSMAADTDACAGATDANGSASASETNRNPYLRTCIQRLSAHVRMLPFPKHLLSLTREIGFVREDLNVFRRLQSLHIICPRLAHHEHTIDHHDQGQEDTRYRGNLKTHLYSTIVVDQRSNRLQLLSRGHPMVTLAQCSEYWDGKSICPLTSDKRRSILDMYNQWRVEDLDCVALSYVPVPHKVSGIFTKSKSDQLALRNGMGMLPPVYLVDDSVSGDINFRETMGATAAVAAVESNDIASFYGGGGGGASRGRGRSQPNVSPVASAGSNDDSRRFMPQGMSSMPSTHRALSPSSRHRNERGLGPHASDAASSLGFHASELETAERDSLLWQIQDDQIFLGMVASGVQPKRTIPDFIEDLTASGIRFVYFSPRNMRRSKLLAEKMGIETDWNCAISLRPLESDGPDPHRMTSNYSDWDVKARLPHGVEAIKRHLEEVDNVPLLVSLYTDSTTDTIGEMISIFQENDEVVMGVGSSLKASNAALFAKADISVALQTGFHTLFDEQLPRGMQAPVFSQDDVEFSQLLNTLACSFSVQSSDSSCSSGHATSGLPQLIELIRLGRCMLTNFHQMIAFIFVSQLFLATLILATYIVPFPSVPQLSCGSIFWFLWVLVPALSLSMLASPEEKDVMKRTPRKNEAISLGDSDSDMPRLAWYFVLRHVPSVVVAILIYESIFGFSLEANRATLDESHRSYRWIDFVLHSSITQERPRPTPVVAAMDRAEAAMIFFVGISVIVSSTSYLYRCESIFAASPLRNRIWTATASVLVGVQLVVSVGCAGLTGRDGMTLSVFVVHVVPWYYWCGLLSWPVVTLVVDEVVKSHDRHHLTRYYKFLRMQFDTRLGMWSPK
jgi:hypothetical protein